MLNELLILCENQWKVKEGQTVYEKLCMGSLHMSSIPCDIVVFLWATVYVVAMEYF